ncbi:MAG: Protein-disulfide isomerase [Rhodobacteraceae bacterium HLUCCA12]|nr:MAG: Protein-disulfide isomerase [Rhodobacteraceae bacterium HLUCCA12]
MFRSFAVSAATALALASPLAAQSGGFGEDLDDEGRAALRAEIRDYLMAHPEVIFEAVAEFERRNVEQQADMDATLVEINADDIFDDGYSWVGGNPDGDITLVEFMDYRCSFCRRAFPQMMDFAESDGNVRLVVKEFPILGPESETMSRFAVAVHQLGGDETYFAAHERLMSWEGEVRDSALGGLASELGLDAEAVLERMDTAAVSEIISSNRALAQRLQISGTPSFVMGTADGNAEMLRGFLPAEELHNLASQLRG